MTDEQKKVASSREDVSDRLKQLERIADSFKDFPERAEKMITSIFSATDESLSKFITIGYASFFAIWALIRDEMTGGQTLLTALFMLISVTLYVLDEIVRAFYLNSLTNSWSDAAGNIQDRLNTFSEMAKGVSRQMKIHEQIRPWVFRTMIVFALLAMGTMLHAVISNIWSIYLADPRMVKS